MPDLFETIFSAEMLAAITAIVTATKLLRNVVNVKGTPAIIVTGAVSLFYSFVQYSADGIMYAVVVGLTAFAVSAGVFKGTKLLGKKVGVKSG